METLAKRELLASDLGAISGTAYIDLANDGIAVDDPRLEAVEIRLFRDGGDGTFDGGTVDDVLVDTVFSGAGGEFRFDNLSPGLYFIQQDAASSPAGLIVPDPVAVNVVNDSGVTVQTIDALDQTPLDLTANAGQPIDSDISVAPEAIGGVRKSELTYTDGPSDVRMIVLTSANRLSVDSVGGTTGSAVVRYDGDTDGITLVADGLGGVDLSGGDAAAGFVLEVQTDQLGNSFELVVYSDADNFSTVTVDYPAESLNNTIQLFVPFSDFTQGGTAVGPADFTDTGAIELFFDIDVDQNTRVTIFETVRPEIVTANLASFEPITLGNLVFRDDNNDGLFDPATEVGIAGVDVELYQMTDLTDVVDPNTQTPIAVTTTDASGNYQFTGLIPGFYAAVIPAREFDPADPAPGAGTLVDFRSSDPVDPTPGANAKVPNDDDGREVPGELFVITETFQLISRSEPDGDGSVNNTVDFGFVSPDLAVSKTFVEVAVDGDDRSATFQVELSNNGLVTLTGITVVDTLPDGLTFNSVGTVGDPTTQPPEITSVTVDGNEVTFEVADLAVGETFAFLLIADIAGGTTGPLVNTAVASSDQNDVIPENDTDEAPFTLPETDLSIEKTVETPGGDPIPPATVQTGDTIVYRVVATNNGPDNASGVTVVDTLPTNVTFVEASLNGGPAGQGITFDPGTGQVTAEVGNLNDGETATLLITVTVDAGAGELISNSAVVSNSPDTDPDPTNNATGSIDTGVVRNVDLAVEKVLAGGADPAFGGSVTYEITVTNLATSPGDARGFTMTDTLPAGLTFVGGSFDAGGSGVTIDAAGQVLTFTGVPLNVGQAVTFTYDVNIAQDAPASLTNDAVLEAFNDGTTVDVDIDETNNQDAVTITPQRQVDLTVTKGDGLAGGQTATPGGEITYEIIVTNTGVSDAVNVQVTDTLPPGVTATSITVDGSQVTDNNPDAGTVGFVIPSVPTGVENAVTVLLTAIISSTATGSITNTVEISGGGVGNPPDGNIAEVTTELEAAVDVAVTKDGPETVIPGQTITYTLELVNTGPSAATDVTVMDNLPAGLTLESVTINGTDVDNTGTGNNIEFVIPQLGVGQGNAQTVTITAAVAPSATGSLENTVNVAADGDTDPANNTSTFTTQLTPQADVGVTQSVTPTSVNPEDQLTFTIIVSNAGPSTAQGVTLTNTLPAGVTFISGTGPGGALSANGQVITANIGSLSPTADQTFTIIAQVDAGASGQLTNSASVTATTNDPNTANNTATATATVIPPTTEFTVTGTVFLDFNNNNVRDPGEPGVAGQTVHLRDQANNIIETTETDADGVFSFPDVPDGTYIVDVVPGPRFDATTANPTSTAAVTVAGGNVTAPDIGLLRIPSKRDLLRFPI